MTRSYRRSLCLNDDRPVNVMGGKSSKDLSDWYGRSVILRNRVFVLMKQIISFFGKIYVYIYIYMYIHTFFLFDPPASMLWTSYTTCIFDQATMRQESGRPERPRPVEEPPIWVRETHQSRLIHPQKLTVRP